LPQAARNRIFRAIPTLFVLALILLGCATAPYTGREQLILVSQSEGVALGTRAYGEILSTSKLSHNETVVNMVRRVGRKIAGVADQEFPDVTKGYKWEFNVIEDEKPNAFALPGGKPSFFGSVWQRLNRKDRSRLSFFQRILLISSASEYNGHALEERDWDREGHS
jgi:Zn-dependent protease with chaperone function